MIIDFRFVSYNRHSATLLKLHVIGIIHINCIHHVHCTAKHYISLHLNLKKIFASWLHCDGNPGVEIVWFNFSNVGLP